MGQSFFHLPKCLCLSVGKIIDLFFAARARAHDRNGITTAPAPGAFRPSFWDRYPPEGRLGTLLVTAVCLKVSVFRPLGGPLGIGS